MLTQKRLKEVLKYDPETGDFTRVVGVKGQGGNPIAGSYTRGYREISVDRERVKSHRLAWLYVYGYLPENDIDHINGEKDDNRIDNLREVSRRCNLQNCRTSKNNTSGFNGVSFDRQTGKWLATICIGRKNYKLGRYSKILDAALARYTAEICSNDWVCNGQNNLIVKIKEY